MFFTNSNLLRAFAGEEPLQRRKIIDTLQMETLSLETKVTLKQAYLVMFDYLNNYWEETGKSDDLGALLGELLLWYTKEGKEPMDSGVFPQWLKSAKNVLEQEQTNKGYINADSKLTK